MKKLTVLGVLALAITAISCSPEKKGVQIAKKYCHELRQGDTMSLPSQFVSLKEAAMASVNEKYVKVMADLADDSGKVNRFVAGFNNYVAAHDTAFVRAYGDAVKNLLESERWWYREKDPNKYFTYAFADDSLTVINCKGKTPYRVHGDTLFLADNDSTTLIVEFPGDSVLVVRSLYDFATVQYRKAETKDLLMGTWLFRTEMNMLGKYRSSWLFVSDNGGYYGEEWQGNWYEKVSGYYSAKSVNDSTVYFVEDSGRNGVKGNLAFKGIDRHIRFYSGGGNESLARSKKKELTSLSFMAK